MEKMSYFTAGSESDSTYWTKPSAESCERDRIWWALHAKGSASAIFSHLSARKCTERWKFLEECSSEWGCPSLQQRLKMSSNPAPHPTAAQNYRLWSLEHIHNKSPRRSSGCLLRNPWGRCRTCWSSYAAHTTWPLIRYLGVAHRSSYLHLSRPSAWEVQAWHGRASVLHRRQEWSVGRLVFLQDLEEASSLFWRLFLGGRHLFHEWKFHEIHQHCTKLWWHFFAVHHDLSLSVAPGKTIQLQEHSVKYHGKLFRMQ